MTFRHGPELEGRDRPLESEGRIDKRSLMHEYASDTRLGMDPGA